MVSVAEPNQIIQNFFFFLSRTLEDLRIGANLASLITSHSMVLIGYQSSAAPHTLP